MCNNNIVVVILGTTGVGRFTFFIYNKLKK